MASEESDLDSVLTPQSDVAPRSPEEFYEVDSLYSNFENSLYSTDELDIINTPTKHRNRTYRVRHKDAGDTYNGTQRTPEEGRMIQQLKRHVYMYYNKDEDNSPKIKTILRHHKEKEQSPEPDVIGITHELQHISSKLKDENKWLNEKKKDLKKREQILAVAQKNFQTIVDLEVKRKVETVEKGYREELEKTYSQLKEKIKDYKRLKENFDTLKTANDSLRLEVETLNNEHVKSEKQIMSLQARLTNLQRLQEQNQRQPLVVTNLAPKTMCSKSGTKLQKESSEKQVKKSFKTSKALQCMSELLPTLLDWVVDTQLVSPLNEVTLASKPAHRLWQNSTASMDSPEKSDMLQERCMKVIPILVDLLRHFPFHAGQLYLPSLQFIHWAIKYLEEKNSQSKSGLVTTLRRLGEELYHPRTAMAPMPSKCNSEDEDSSDQRQTKVLPTSLPHSSIEDKSKEGLYLKSPDPHIRLLSCFIILRTMTQVNLLANVLDELKGELQYDSAKELFLYYQATPIILQYMKPVHKALVSNSIDVFLPLTMESQYLQPFLVSCSNEAWFRTVALVLRTTNLDNKVFEKLSIILQKLSKIKSNKKLFDIYSITNLIQDLSRSMTTSGSHDNSFLDLNLRSILFNLCVSTSQSDRS